MNNSVNTNRNKIEIPNRGLCCFLYYTVIFVIALFNPFCGNWTNGNDESVMGPYGNTKNVSWWIWATTTRRPRVGCDWGDYHALTAMEICHPVLLQWRAHRHSVCTRPSPSLSSTVAPIPPVTSLVGLRRMDTMVTRVLQTRRSHSGTSWRWGSSSMTTATTGKPGITSRTEIRSAQKRKGRQGGSLGIHWRHWSVSSTSPVNIRTDGLFVSVYTIEPLLTKQASCWWL